MNNYQNHSRFARTQHGFSMVELMVAITISLLLLAGVIQIFLASRQTYTLQDGMSRLQENARYALGRVSQDIARSGFMGCRDSAEPDAFFNNLVDQSQSFDFETAIFGQDNAGTDGTDILTLRFGTSGGIPFDTDTDNAFWFDDTTLALDPDHPNYDQLEQYDLLTFSDCSQTIVLMITNDPETAGGLIEFQPGVVAPNGQANNALEDLQLGTPIGATTTSFASAFTVSSSTYLVGPSFSSNGNALFINSIDNPDNELIQGVDDFQVEFGVNDDNDLGADRYVDADDVGAADWNDVVSVRMTLALNTVDPVQAGTTISKDFTATVRLRNRGDIIH